MAEYLQVPGSDISLRENGGDAGATVDSQISGEAVFTSTAIPRLNRQISGTDSVQALPDEPLSPRHRRSDAPRVSLFEAYGNFATSQSTNIRASIMTAKTALRESVVSVKSDWDWLGASMLTAKSHGTHRVSSRPSVTPQYLPYAGSEASGASSSKAFGSGAASPFRLQGEGEDLHRTRSAPQLSPRGKQDHKPRYKTMQHLESLGEMSQESSDAHKEESSCAIGLSSSQKLADTRISQGLDGPPGAELLLPAPCPSLTPSGEDARTVSRRESSNLSRDSDVSDGLTIKSAVFLMVTAIIGCGVVALPSLMKLGGWILAPAIAAAVSLAFNEIGRVLHVAITLAENPKHSPEVSLHDALRGPGGEVSSEPRQVERIASFEDFGRRAAGHSGMLLVRTITTTGFFGTLVVYTILISQNVYCVLNGVVSREVVLACIVPLLLMLSMLKDLQAMAQIMPIGVFASLTSCLLICIKATLDSRLWIDSPPNDLHNIWPYEYDSIGTIMAVLFAAYSVMGTVPSIRGQMQDPKEFPTAFRCSLTIVFVVYLAVMLIGYYGYGNCVKDNVVSSMMHPGKLDDASNSKRDHRAPWWETALQNSLATCMASLVSVYLLIGFTLFFTCVIGIVQRGAPENALCIPLSWQNRLFRVFIVLAVSGIGLCLPYFREVMAIMSSICVTFNNVFFPLFFAHKLEWDLPPDDPARTPVWRRCFHVLIFALGVSCFCMGLHDSVLKLIAEMSHHKESG